MNSTSPDQGADHAPTFFVFAPAAILTCAVTASIGAGAAPVLAESGGDQSSQHLNGRRLFEDETFGGNGRTCPTCHSRDTGTVSPADAQARVARDPLDPLFAGDGSDDGAGNGVTRMKTDATILMRISLAPNVSLLDDPLARTVTLRRGIPTTLNTPALDPVLMYDGRQPHLESQALGAILYYAQASRVPSAQEFARSPRFNRRRHSSARPSCATWRGPARRLQAAARRTAAERRERRFFEDALYRRHEAGHLRHVSQRPHAERNQ